MRFFEHPLELVQRKSAKNYPFKIASFGWSALCIVHFDIAEIVKKFMLKLHENSDKWQIYCIRQPKKGQNERSEQSWYNLSTFNLIFFNLFYMCRAKKIVNIN
ncbi:hypothetical protein BpHYR1_000991 [Brachionus plicatilis]|uniref:Uncharacterized protein n=1 Tax=Brachionus plicatilis TaxID=10195 RepID=A0A3M7RQS1_BRAPC|nr:hypothetical protein BpHYR1_000991 [Brachionus plicatilis]